MFPELPLRAWLHWLVRLAVIVLLATVLERVLGAAELVRSAELLSRAAAVTVATCAVLTLLTACTPKMPARETLGWAAFGGLATGALAAAMEALDGDAAALAVGTFLLASSFGLTLTLAVAVLRDRLAACALLLAVTALATAAPLWLGPVAERFAATGGLVDAVVAASPLTYLAVLADFDYLRATWFYEHSALGSLRYDYPAAASLSFVYALPFIAAAALELPRFRNHARLKELKR